MHGKNQGKSGRSPVVTGDGDKSEEVWESVCETPQPGVDAKVYGSRSGTLEQLRLSVEQYLRRQRIGRHC